jgi:hypothetical protein
MEVGVLEVNSEVRRMVEHPRRMWIMEPAEGDMAKEPLLMSLA